MIKFLLLIIFMGASAPVFSVNSRAPMLTQITGGDELYQADVVLENGAKKLVVKATVVPDLGQRFQEKLKNGASSSLIVNGSVTPVVFTLTADPAKDKIIEECNLWFLGNGIKLDTFINLNSELTNGLLIEILSNGVSFSFFPIKSTVDINHYFGTGSARFRIDVQSGLDYTSGFFNPGTPFVLKAGSGDYVRITVRDNILSVAKGEMLCDGVLD